MRLELHSCPPCPNPALPTILNNLRYTSWKADMLEEMLNWITSSQNTTVPQCDSTHKLGHNSSVDFLISWTPENLPIAMIHRRCGEDDSSTVCINRDNWPFLLHIYFHCCLLDRLFSIFNFTPTLFHCSMLISWPSLSSQYFPLEEKFWLFSTLAWNRTLFLELHTQTFPTHTFPVLHFHCLCKIDLWD